MTKFEGRGSELEKAADESPLVIALAAPGFLRDSHLLIAVNRILLFVLHSNFALRHSNFRIFSHFRLRIDR